MFAFENKPPLRTKNGKLFLMTFLISFCFLAKSMKDQRNSYRDAYFVHLLSKLTLFSMNCIVVGRMSDGLSFTLMYRNQPIIKIKLVFIASKVPYELS